MAEKDLRGVVFPGLPGTYAVPVVDATLSQEGQAADAKETGDRLRALETASGADGMTREFNSGAINVDSYTTPGAMSKIYVVTVRINGINYSITVDWQGIKAAGGERTFGIAAKNAGGTIAIFDLVAALNTGSTVTFEVAGGTIVHVCGYY